MLCDKCKQLLVGNRFVKVMAAIHHLVTVVWLVVVFLAIRQSASTLSILLWSSIAFFVTHFSIALLVWRLGSYKSYKTAGSDNGGGDFKLDSQAEQDDDSNQILP